LFIYGERWFILTTIIENIEKALGQPNLLFNTWQGIIRITITSIVFYFLLIFILKFLGNRSIGNFSVYDFVATLTIGSVVSSTLVFREITFLNGLLAVVIFLLLQYSVSRLISKWPGLNRLLNPSPKVVFFKGKFMKQNMKKARINRDEIYAAIRLQTNRTSDQIYAVILETNGSLSVVIRASAGYEHEITRFL